MTGHATVTRQSERKGLAWSQSQTLHASVQVSLVIGKHQQGCPGLRPAFFQSPLVLPPKSSVMLHALREGPPPRRIGSGHLRSSWSSSVSLRL